MYSKEELRQLKKDFWEGYAAFCRNMPEMSGRKDDFLLNTKMKGVQFRYDATRRGAEVILEINLRDENERLRIYSQLERFRPMMEVDFPEGLIWDFAYVRPGGKEVCRIYSRREGIDIHRRDDWPEFYLFLSANMLKLEQAFLMVKEAIR